MIASCMASESVYSQRSIASCGSASTHAGSCHREWVCADTLVRRGEIEACMHLRGPQELCVWIAQGRQHAAQRLVCGRLAVQAAASPLQAHPLIRDSDSPLTSTSQLPLSWPHRIFGRTGLLELLHSSFTVYCMVMSRLFLAQHPLQCLMLLSSAVSAALKANSRALYSPTFRVSGSWPAHAAWEKRPLAS